MNSKTKKAAIRERNRRTHIINKHAEGHKATHEAILREQQETIEARQEASETAARAETTQEITDNNKVAGYRHRIQQKRAGSLERWNRFAGTKASGGRGL